MKSRGGALQHVFEACSATVRWVVKSVWDVMPRGVMAIQVTRERSPIEDENCSVLKLVLSHWVLQASTSI